MKHSQIHFQNWRSDILSGLIVALVSIPISMGYAQIAGLPPVYGLYGSLLPILFYGLLTSSPQFVVGVDAMPAVMVGNALSNMGLLLGSEEAISLVPVISLLTSAWFILFYLFRINRIVKTISRPVMGGFISGIGATIILMQLPKLFGGEPGTGELPALLMHLASQISAFHPLSALLGFATVILILLGKRLAPRIPVSVILLFLGVVLTAWLHVDRYGVRLLPTVEAGLPRLRLPDARLMVGRSADLLFLSLSISLVVMAQTLLASSNYANKYHYKIETRRELLAYAAAELAGSLVGCCPINGSVSRAGIADQFRCRSQLMSISAFLVMLLVLLFGTGFLCYLPVPILTGIVVAALIGILEIRMATNLWRSSKQEFLIFMTAFAGVLLFGTVYGVVIGVLLSFFAVVVRAVIPPKAFLGQIAGHEGFYNIRRNRSARPITGTILYRFSGNLFFANFEAFRDDLEKALQSNTKAVIVDARGIGSIDITAAESLLQLSDELNTKGIRFYICEHVGSLNDQLRQLGAGALIDNGSVRRTIPLALRDMGLEPPYSLDGVSDDNDHPIRDERESYAEFEWLYGDEAESRFNSLAKEIASILASEPELSLVEAERRSSWGRVGLFDEDMLLDYVELNLEEMAQSGALADTKLEELETHVEELRPVTEAAWTILPPRTQDYMKRHREQLKARMAGKHPQQYERVVRHRQAMAERRKERSEN